MKEADIMNSTSDRPNGHPDKWIMVFGYDDKLSSGGWSRPIPHDTKEAAITAAQSADRDHNGGGITVEWTRAYPPAGVDEEPVDFDFRVGPC